MRNSLSSLSSLKRGSGMTAGGGGAFISSPVLISGLVLADGIYVARVGTPLTAVTAAVSGATIGLSAWQWQLNGADIGGATSQNYTPTGAVYPGQLRVRQTMTLSNGQVLVATSIAFDVAYAVPVATGTLANQSFILGAGVETYATAFAFTGVDIVYSVTGPAGVTINSSTGVVSIDKSVTGPVAGEVVSVLATNPAGSVALIFSLTVAASLQTVPDRILKFPATGQGILRQTITAGSWSGGTNSKTLIGAIFHLDVGETYVEGNIGGVFDGASANRYFRFTPTRSVIANTTENVSGTILPDPGAGFHVATMVLGSGGSFVHRLLRDDTETTDSSAVSSTNFNISAVNGTRLSFGTRDSGGSLSEAVRAPFRHKLCGGYHVESVVGQETNFLTNAKNFHNWIWNSGAPRKPANYDFAANGLVLVAYWDLATVGNPAFNAVGTATEDTIGALDAWTDVNANLAWILPGAPWPAGAATATIVAASVEAADPTKLILTINLPSGVNWGTTRTVNVDALDLWSERGPSFNPKVVSATTSAAGRVLTVTCTLARSIYVGEPLRLQALANSVTDTDQNGTASTPLMVVTNNSATAWPSLWSGVSMRRIAFKWTTPVQGWFWTDLQNICGILAGAGNITEEYPARVNGPGALRHGAMKNPVRTDDTYPHGFFNKSGSGYVYSVAAEVSLPYSLAVGDSVVKARGNANPNDPLVGGDSNSTVYVNHYCGIVCMAAAPTANQTPPVAISLLGGGAKPTPATFNASAVAATLRTDLSTASLIAPAPPSLDQLLGYMNNINYGGMIFATSVGRNVGTATGITATTGYGRNFAAVTDSVMAYLASDAASADKARLLWLTFIAGEQINHIVKAPGTYKIPADGGQGQGWYARIVTFLVNSGRTSELATMQADFGTNELGQCIALTAPILAKITTPHDFTTTDYPRFNKRRQILAVAGSQVTFSFPGSKDCFTDLTIVREAGGSWPITAWSYNSTTNIVTLTIPGHTFAVNDWFYVQTPYTQIVGDFEWTTGGWLNLDSYNPRGAADYRELQVWMGQFSGVHALGWLHSSHAAWKGYTLRAYASSVPTATHDYPSAHGTLNGNGWCADFFALHQTAILATTQTVG